MNKSLKLPFLLVFPLALGAGLDAPASPKFHEEMLDHGSQTMTLIRSGFYLPRSQLYAEEMATTGVRPDGTPSFAWPAGVQLSALTAAARVDRERYLPDLRNYIDALDAYWITSGGLKGYNSSAHPRSPDRYYDDNAWLVLSLVEAYQITADPKDLQRARDSLKFVLSGADTSWGVEFGGGKMNESRRTPARALLVYAGQCAFTRLQKSRRY